MKLTFDPPPFKANPSRRESKDDETTKVARKIVEIETAARNAKTARLRAARLAGDPGQAVVPEKSAGGKPKRTPRP